MGGLIPTQQKEAISVNLDPQNDLSNLSRHPDAQEHTVGCQLEFPGVGTRVIRRFRLFRYADPSDAMQLRRYPETSIAIWHELDCRRGHRNAGQRSLVAETLPSPSCVGESIHGQSLGGSPIHRPTTTHPRFLFVRTAG